MGSCLDARLAGVIPKINPTLIDTKNERATENTDTIVFISVKYLINMLAVTPQIMPKIPPLTLIVTDSLRN